MMNATRLRQTPFSPATDRARPGSRARAHARADGESDHIGRRNALLTGTLILPSLHYAFTAPATADEIPKGKSRIELKNLNSFQRNAERAAFTKIVEGELRKELKSTDAPDTLRLVLHDAGTYDVSTNTGGLNGSVVLEEELNRPENQSLRPLVDRLKKVKSAIDAETTKKGYGPISWADLEVLSAKIANEREWARIKKLRGIPSSGEIISSAFGAAWPVKLGRVDTDKPDPAGRIPTPDASVPQITEFFARLNNRSYGSTGFFAPKPIFDERQAFLLYTSAQADTAAAEAKLAAEPNTQFKKFKNKYDQSKDTVTRTDYEVDLIDYFNQLANLGSKFNPDAYLVPILIDTPKL